MIFLRQRRQCPQRQTRSIGGSGGADALEAALGVTKARCDFAIRIPVFNLFVKAHLANSFNRDPAV
jgi:hypothetical protein